MLCGAKRAPFCICTGTVISRMYFVKAAGMTDLRGKSGLMELVEYY